MPYDSILDVFKQDGWRFGYCSVIVYDRHREDIFGRHFLRDLYDGSAAAGILGDLFCGMTDLSADAICGYLSTRNPLLILAVDRDYADGRAWETAGFAFPTVMVGGRLVPSVATGEPPRQTEKSILIGYGFLREWWGKPEITVLAMLMSAYFFVTQNLVALHGQSYPWNRLTSKFIRKFGAYESGRIPKFLDTRDGVLVDSVVSTLMREDFESYVRKTLLQIAE